MLVYNCRPSDSVIITTPKDKITLTVDTIINKNPMKQVQLSVNSNEIKNSYLLKPFDSFSVKAGMEYLEIKLGHTSPSRTVLYVGSLDDAVFKYHKGI